MNSRKQKTRKELLSDLRLASAQYGFKLDSRIVKNKEAEKLTLIFNDANENRVVDNLMMYILNSLAFGPFTLTDLALFENCIDIVYGDDYEN